VTHPVIDVEAIRALAAILDETGLTEIEVSEKDTRIRVARTPAPVTAYAAPQAAAAAASQGPLAPAAPDAAGDPARHPGAVKSPMVGVAYLSPEPGAPAFIAPGQSVAAGQTLLLIEAMKTFNQIKAPKAGTIGRILIENGAPVEYGEPLIIIE
jgi:acetyl-CoA carboxylase biotin carboxyl carrier protein